MSITSRHDTPNATYSYGSAPVGNFQIVYRPPGPKPTPEEIQRGLDAVFGKRVWPTGDAA